MPTRSGSRRILCRVEFYAGSRGEETPRLVAYGGRRYKVEQILDRRRVWNAGSGSTAEEFRLILGGRTVTLSQTPSGRWQVVLPRA